MGASPRSVRATERAWRGGCAAGLLAVALVPSAFASPPPAREPVPHDAAHLARALVDTDAGLRGAIAAWSDRSSPPPADAVLYALYEQRIYRTLARDDALARATVARLPAPLARAARDLVAAQSRLYRLTPPIPAKAIRVASPPAATRLLGWYREGSRRFRVPWNVLAAVHFAESKFGKIRSASAAGAQGPMQFLPSTWRRYGLGGDIRDPHDAILGAANYLRAAGAPGNLRRALFAYNHSSAYVDSVLRYARRMAADRTSFFALYLWQVFVKTPSGDRRVTGPDLP
jgi:membrane-bound lytic murein transglycosylase B